MTTKRNRDFFARLSVYGLPKKAGKVATWLRKMADSIEDDPSRYTDGRFTARLMKNPLPRPLGDRRRVAGLVLVLAAVLLWPFAAQAVGTVTVTVTALPGTGLTKYEIVWVSDASGDVSGNAFGVRPGALKQIGFTPSATAAPTTLYDVTLTYDTADLLIGAGDDLSATVSTVARPTPSAIHDGLAQLDLVVANAGNAKGGTVVLWIGAP